MMAVMSSKVIPVATSRAINETLVTVRKDATEEVANELRLPKTVVRKRRGASGNVVGDRVRLKRARRTSLVGRAEVGLRGILVAEVAGAQTKAGVKAKGGRLYRGAFKQTVRGRTGFVLKRITRARYPTFAPRIGVRRRLMSAFEKRITGGEGRRIFIQRYRRLMQREIRKKGFA